MTTGAAARTADDARRAHAARGVLAVFNDAGVLAAADVHVAQRLLALDGDARVAADALRAAAHAGVADVEGAAEPADAADAGNVADVEGAGTDATDADEAGDPAAADAIEAGDPADATAAARAEDAVLLGIALAVRAVRLGHVCADLATARATVTTEGDAPVDVAALPWPDPAAWRAALRASPLVAAGPDPADGNPADADPAVVAQADAGDGADARPLRLDGSRLYLDRYWREERAVAVDLRTRAAVVDAVDEAALAAALDRLFPDSPPGDRQRDAAATAARRRLTVVAGGPGTGKTTTVARILALLVAGALAEGRPLPRIALAAPTGKAAARLEEAVHDAAHDLAADGRIDAAVRDRLLAVEAATIHRLLGWRPGSRSRFRHDRDDRLPQDVVVVDETSMVSLSLMARLVAAVRDGARLVLVGDPEQLASVEAGAVLGDVVGPLAGPLPLTASETPRDVAPDPAPPAAIAGSIVVLRRVHRYGPVLAELAEAIQRGDDDAVLGVLAAGHAAVRLVAADLATTRPGDPVLAPVREAAVTSGRAVAAAAAAGDGRAALVALGAVRLLCAHRRGPAGAEVWREHVAGWLAGAVEGYGAGGDRHPGRPLLVTANDPGLRLFNGDTGVIVAGPHGPVAVFARRGALVEVAPSRLGAVETVHAMTVHKSQGSQFDEVAVLLPEATSPILTRELLYTAVTRARERVTVVGTEDAIRAAVRRPIARASGLRAALWGDR
jgi:exodeoxyribonuclease V alpha subunit